MAGRDNGTTGNHPGADEVAFPRTRPPRGELDAGAWERAREAGSAMAGELMLHIACPRQAALDARLQRRHA